MLDEKLKLWFLFVIIIALALMFLFLFVFKDLAPDHYDFLAEFFQAEKTGFDTDDNPERYMPDSHYVFDHSFVKKEFASIFSINTLLLAEKGVLKNRIEDEVEDGAFRLVFPYKIRDLWKFSFDLKKKTNGNKWSITALTDKGFCQVQIFKIFNGKKIKVDSFNYRLEDRQDNVIVIGFFGDFLVIFSKKEIIYQQKDKALFTSGRVAFSLERVEAKDKRFSLKFAKIEETRKKDLLKHIFSRHKDLRDHMLNARTSIWNELFSRQSLIINGQKNPFLQRIKLREKTMPAVLFKMNSVLKFRLKIPEKAMLDFGITVVPQYVSDIKRLRFYVEIQDTNGETEIKNEIKMSSFSDPFKTFNQVRMDLSSLSGDKKIISFRASTSDGKITDLEEKVIFSISSPSIYLAANDPRPNIVLISLDALKQDHMGCYGYFRDTTSNLDKLAGRSIVFSNAITAANWTIPSHMTILTGLYPLEAGFIPGGLLNAKSFVADNVSTIAQYLKNSGYYTLGVHGGGYVSEFYGFDKGFSDYLKGSKDAAEGVRTIIDNLQLHKDRRFFLFFHTLEIHWPYLRDFYLKDLPAGSSSKDNAIARYDSGIRYTDHYIGELFNWMQINGLYENTIIIVLSDHGETFRLIKEKTAKYTSGSHGSTLHEDEIKIPFIFRIPEVEGRRIEYQVGTVDILPTILDYLEIEPKIDLRGISLIPLMKESVLPKSRFAYSEATNSKKKLQSIRSNDFKLISSSSSIWEMVNSKQKSYRFIDLKNDPDETSNLFKEKQKTAQSYVGFLQRLLASISSNMVRLKQSDQDAQIENKELEEQLKGLGYIGN